MAAPTDYIAYYPLKNDASDVTGNHNGTNYGVTFDGQSGHFDGGGTDDYIDTTYTVGTETARSFGIWFKAEANTYDKTLFSDSDSSASDEETRGSAAFEYSNYEFYLYLAIGDGTISWYDDTVTLTQYLDNEFHHFAMTIDGTSVNVYIDGALFHSYTSDVALGTANTNPYLIGNYGDYWYLDGNLARFRIYNRALSAAEISDIYSDEYGEFYSSYEAFDYIRENVSIETVAFNYTRENEKLIPVQFDYLREDMKLSTEAFDYLRYSDEGYLEAFDYRREVGRDVGFKPFYYVREVESEFSATIIERVT